MAAQLEDLTQELIDMRLSIEGLEKERDFYFGKLRDIEVDKQAQWFKNKAFNLLTLDGRF